MIHVDDSKGIEAGMRFLLSKRPTIEIVKVLRLGSVVLCETTQYGHPIETPMQVLQDRSVDVVDATPVGSTQDEELGLSPLPPGLDWLRANKERKFNLPDELGCHHR